MLGFLTLKDRADSTSEGRRQVYLKVSPLTIAMRFQAMNLVEENDTTSVLNPNVSESLMTNPAT